MQTRPSFHGNFITRFLSFSCLNFSFRVFLYILIAQKQFFPQFYHLSLLFRWYCPVGYFIRDFFVSEYHVTNSSLKCLSELHRRKYLRKSCNTNQKKHYGTAHEKILTLTLYCKQSSNFSSRLDWNYHVAKTHSSSKPKFTHDCQECKEKVPIFYSICYDKTSTKLEKKCGARTDSWKSKGRSCGQQKPQEKLQSPVRNFVSIVTLRRLDPKCFIKQ